MPSLLPWVVYTRLYASLLYHPGYTPVYTVRSVLPGTLSPLVRVCREEALGSNLRLV